MSQTDDRDDSAPGTRKTTDAWVTGDEPAAGAQLSHRETLAREVGADVPGDLTKAHASELIDELRARAARIDS